jgi:hypothetical protein
MKGTTPPAEGHGTTSDKGREGLETLEEHEKAMKEKEGLSPSFSLSAATKSNPFGQQSSSITELSCLDFDTMTFPRLWR